MTRDIIDRRSFRRVGVQITSVVRDHYQALLEEGKFTDGFRLGDYAARSTNSSSEVTRFYVPMRHHGISFFSLPQEDN